MGCRVGVGTGDGEFLRLPDGILRIVLPREHVTKPYEGKKLNKEEFAGRDAVFA